MALRVPMASPPNDPPSSGLVYARTQPFCSEVAPNLISGTSMALSRYAITGANRIIVRAGDCLEASWRGVKTQAYTTRATARVALRLRHRVMDATRSVTDTR